MNPLAATRFLQNMTPTQVNANTGQAASEGATNTQLHFFTVAQTYGGEDWAAGDILLGDLDSDNIVLRSGIWRVRYQDETQLTLGQYGMRIAAGGLGFNQVEIVTAAGANDLTETGEDFMRTSYVLIDSTAGAFSIDSIKAPTHQNQVLYVKNQVANNMTINDAATAGAAPAGYWVIDTQTAAPVATTGIGIAHFIANEDQNVWELVSIRG
jgi:hypothetical protein